MRSRAHIIAAHSNAIRIAPPSPDAAAATCVFQKLTAAFWRLSLERLWGTMNNGLDRP